MTKRCAAALGAVLAFGASAAYSAEKNRGLHIVIDTIPHSQQRYPTVGDWQIDKVGNLHITVSKMRDQRYAFLAAAHEMIEASWGGCVGNAAIAAWRASRRLPKRMTADIRLSREIRGAAGSKLLICPLSHAGMSLRISGIGNRLIDKNVMGGFHALLQGVDADGGSAAPRKRRVGSGASSRRP